MKKVFCTLFILMVILTPFFSQQILNTETSSWNFVLPGTLLCNAECTSNGFITLDESRTLSAFTSDGKKKWEKQVSRGENTYFKILPDDFILVINKNGEELQLLNPTGAEIWKIIPDQKLENYVLPGKDGRFFIKTSDPLCCYGINGIQKWNLPVDFGSELNIGELPDGTLFLVTQDSNQKSSGIRVSPFGEMLEKINFDTRITHLTTHSKGILLNFIDGTSGFIGIKNNELTDIWKIEKTTFKKNNSLASPDFFISSSNSDQIIYIMPEKNSVKVYSINPQTGKPLSYFTIDDFSIPDFYDFCADGLLISDGNKVIYTNLNGITLFSGLYENSGNQKLKYNKLYNNKNYFILFGNDWNANAFLITQSTKSRSLKKDEQKQNFYENLLKVDPSIFGNNLLMQEIDKSIASYENINMLKNGNYGAKERFLLEKMLSGCTAYQSILFTKNSRTSPEMTVFERDITGLGILITQMPLLGINTFTSFISYVIKYETNPTILITTLNTIKENGYDPEGKILNNLYYLAKHIGTNDITISFEICDAVYSICKFMGRPAFNKLGKEILTTFLYPNFNMKTKDYTRKTLKKISKLEL